MPWLLDLASDYSFLYCKFCISSLDIQGIIDLGITTQNFHSEASSNLVEHDRLVLTEYKWPSSVRKIMDQIIYILILYLHIKRKSA